jgi:uncharacterized iron-regulated membrane protein
MTDDSTFSGASRASWASLVTSSGTLVCCTIPALLVALGAGSTLISLTSTFPQLIWMSAHKALIFGIAGVMLLLAGTMQWRGRSAPCPVDPALAQACTRARQQSHWVYAISVALYAIGALFAFVLPALLAAD